jgi:2-keto-4-pentenoate hydratase/2-oxohepta-3-ene-1,7-dioic acid hydratase in catechol pathway
MTGIIDEEPWIFMHEAELALVVRGPAKRVKAADWKTAVFGYTGMIDVSARGEGRRTWRREAGSESPSTRSRRSGRASRRPTRSRIRTTCSCASGSMR